MIKQIHITHKVVAEIILQMGSQIIVQVWVSKPIKGKQHGFQMTTLIEVPNTLQV